MNQYKARMIKSNLVYNDSIVRSSSFKVGKYKKCSKFLKIYEYSLLHVKKSNTLHYDENNWHFYLSNNYNI